MKREDLLHAMNDIDDTYIEEAADAATVTKKHRRFGKRLTAALIAACFVGVFGLGYMTDALQRSSGLGSEYASEAAATAPESSEAKAAGAYAEEDAAAAAGEAYTEDSAMDAPGGTLFGSAEYSTEEAPDSISGPEASAPESGIVDENGTIDTDKLVYTGNLTIQTKDYATSKEAIRKQIQSLGGILESETETDSNYNWYAYDYADTDDASDRSGYLNWDITVRIPTENYQSFLNAVGENGKVIYKTSSVENITKQYNDTSARIEALETQQKKLQDMMDQASTVEDMIAIESRLSDVEYELNSYKTSLSEMDSDVAYSTIYLTLEEVAAYSPRAKENASFGERIVEAFQNSLHYFAKGIETLFFALIYILPFAVVLVLVVLLIRGIRKHRRSK